MSVPFGLWLWADDTYIYWWSTSARGHISKASVPDNVASIGQLLGSNAEDALPYVIEGKEQSAIWLLESLPLVWINHQWENRLYSDGRKIGNIVNIIRQVPDKGIEPRSTLLATRLLFMPMYKDGKMRRWKGDRSQIQKVKSNEILGRSMLDNPGADLLIFAHGNPDSESNSESPLLDYENNPWQWPEQLMPPKTILILACDHDGHQRDFARTLLKRGVKSVVVATDLLNADDAWAAAEDFSIARLKQGFSLASWVRGHEHLELWGQDLLIAAPEQQNEFGDWQTKAAWISLQAALSGKRREVQNLWKQRYHVDKENAESARTWLESLLQWLNQCHQDPIWNGIKSDMLGMALDFAERHHHGLIPILQKHYGNGDLVDGYNGLAKIAYREGAYNQSLRYLGRAFGQTDRQSRPLSTLLNIMIDFNLPVAAEEVLRALEDQKVGWVNDELASREFKLLDQQSRLSVRSGDFDSALSYQKQKREQAQFSGEDTSRETACLLLLYAWGKPSHPHALQLADIATQHLQKCDTSISRGNSNSKYLARALACWVWRTGADPEVPAMRALKYFWTIRSEDCNYDSGPLGQTAAYLSLWEREQHSPGWADKAWFSWRNRMKRDGYWLEIAIFDALMNNFKDAAESYEEFLSRRSELIPILETESFQFLWKGGAIKGTMDGRKESEKKALFQSPLSIKQLIGSGLIPI